MKEQKAVTELLQAYADGENVIDDLIPIVYQELKAIARKTRFKYHGNETLNTTALVHEAYFKLIGPGKHYRNKNHFMAVAAKAMRQIMLNYAYKKQAQKREGNKEKVEIDENHIFISDDNCTKLIQLEEAMVKLEEVDKKQVQIIECRFFADMTIEDTADALSISPSTVKRSWHLAKVLLYQYMKEN